MSDTAALGGTPPIVMIARTSEGEQRYEMQPEACYALFRQGISKFMGNTDKPGANPEAARVARLMKAGVKGILLSFGNTILDFALGKDHARPGRGDDLIDWYTDMFAKIGIAYAMKNSVVVDGAKIGPIIQIHSIHTESNSHGSRTPG